MRRPFPPLTFRGVTFPDVPEGAAVFVAPVWTIATGAAGVRTFRGIDGLYVNEGSFNLWRRRGHFQADVPLVARVLGFGAGVERNTPTWGAAVDLQKIELTRDDLDIASGGLARSDAADLVAVLGGEVTSPCSIAIPSIEVGGEVPFWPLLPGPAKTPVVESGIAARFRMVFNDGTGIAANTVVRGVIVVAVFEPDDRDATGEGFTP